MNKTLILIGTWMIAFVFIRIVAAIMNDGSGDGEADFLFSLFGSSGITLLVWGLMP